MLPVPQEILKRLQIVEAINEEAESWQSLLPKTPGWDFASTDAARLAGWLDGQLQAGLEVSPQVVVSTRKVQHGVRPVPIWGLAERVTYRALVDFILRNEPELDRSPDAYLRFIGAPIEHAREVDEVPVGRISLSVGSASFEYVVKAAINAFYEYIDHAVLSRELLSRTGDYSAIACLMSLLADVQGRAYGLPQLLDASDRLSEIYADLVERQVLRRGWPTWRFNDDFRIAVRSFSAGLAAIEDLAAAARDVGLTLNDVKTTTPRFSTYAFETFGLGIDDELPAELSRHDPEDFVGDYVEGVGETDPSWAIALLQDANSPEYEGSEWTDHGIALANVRGEDVRRLRRALARLERAGVADALPHVLKLVVYVPSLTPWAIRYIISAGAEAPESAAAVVRDLIAHVSLSNWQRLWIARCADELSLLSSDQQVGQEIVLRWIQELRRSEHGPVASAEAALALARVGRIEFAELERCCTASRVP